jgi:hypothetical protein
MVTHKNILHKGLNYMQLLVREANKGDSKAISSIGVSSWQAAYQGIVPNDYLDSLSVEKREKHVSISLAVPTYRFAIAEIEGQPVGMICFYPVGEVASIGNEWEIEAVSSNLSWR